MASSVVDDAQGADTQVSMRRRARRWVYHRLMRGLTGACLVALGMAKFIGRRPRARRDERGATVLLTGRFESDNWIRSHVQPMAESQACARVWVVAAAPVPKIPKVEGIVPARWLMRLIGATPARLLVFAWVGLWRRPDAVGGFHLLVNGLAAILLARLVGARSLHFCVGGACEVLDGGVHGDANPFTRMETPDAVVERRLLRAVNACDLMITMGPRAIEYYRRRGVNTEFRVISGGIDAEAFSPCDGPRATDLILVGRLAPIKRIDVFLRAVRLVAEERPGLSAVIVGDGVLRELLERLTRELGIERQVRLVGRQDNVSQWLRQAKLFVLSSDSEGLSLALMEAMMSGLPAIVSNVGDLPDLVDDGVNGYLVERRSPEELARRILELLADDGKRQAFSRAARQAALRYSIPSASRRWDAVLGQLQSPPTAVVGQAGAHKRRLARRRRVKVRSMSR